MIELLDKIEDNHPKTLGEISMAVTPNPILTLLKISVLRDYPILLLLTMTTIKRTGIHYAWIILAVTFACLFVGSALRSIPGIIMLSLEQEFHWSRELSAVRLRSTCFCSGSPGHSWAD